MVSFEIFVKAMPLSLSELKVLPSFCFAFKIPDDRAVTTKYYYILRTCYGKACLTWEDQLAAAHLGVYLVCQGGLEILREFYFVNLKVKSWKPHQVLLCVTQPLFPAQTL